MFKTAIVKNPSTSRLPLAVGIEKLKAWWDLPTGLAPRATWSHSSLRPDSAQLVYLMDRPRSVSYSDLFGVVAIITDDFEKYDFIKLGNFNSSTAANLYLAFRSASVLMRNTLPRNTRSDATTWRDFVQAHIKPEDRPVYHFPANG